MSCNVNVLVQATLVGFCSLVVIEYIHWVLIELYFDYLVQSLSLYLLHENGIHIHASVSCQEAWDCHGGCWKSQFRKVSRRHGEFKPRITSTCHRVQRILESRMQSKLASFTDSYPLKLFRADFQKLHLSTKAPGPWRRAVKGGCEGTWMSKSPKRRCKAWQEETRVIRNSSWWKYMEMKYVKNTY